MKNLKLVIAQLDDFETNPFLLQSVVQAMGIDVCFCYVVDEYSELAKSLEDANVDSYCFSVVSKKSKKYEKSLKNILKAIA